MISSSSGKNGTGYVTNVKRQQENDTATFSLKSNTNGTEYCHITVEESNIDESKGYDLDNKVYVYFEGLKEIKPTGRYTADNVTTMKEKKSITINC